MTDREIVLVYDKECPVCDAYCRTVRVDEREGRLQMVDARESSRIMDEITALGLDIDQGMVVKLDGHLHYGSDAIHALARVSRRTSVFDRLNRLAFQTTDSSRRLYPILRTLRNLLLKILGKSKINNLERPGNDRF